MLYQGLKPYAYYWEFVNTLRKVLILFFSTVLSQLSVYYTALTSIAIMIILAKLQHIVDPYENKRNNKVELKAILAGTMTLYCGVLFEQDKENEYAGFMILAVVLLFIVNMSFIIEWLYMFIKSFNFKNDISQIILQFFAALLLQKHEIKWYDDAKDKIQDQKVNHSMAKYSQSVNIISKHYIRYRQKKEMRKVCSKARETFLFRSSQLKNLFDGNKSEFEEESKGDSRAHSSRQQRYLIKAVRKNSRHSSQLSSIQIAPRYGSSKFGSKILIPESQDLSNEEDSKIS